MDVYKYVYSVHYSLHEPYVLLRTHACSRWFRSELCANAASVFIKVLWPCLHLMISFIFTLHTRDCTVCVPLVIHAYL